MKCIEEGHYKSVTAGMIDLETPNRLKQTKMNNRSTMALASSPNELISTLMIFLKFGSLEMDLSGRNTRNPRTTEKFGSPGTKLRMLANTIIKSKTFQPSFRYASLPRRNPKAIDLRRHSAAKMTVNTISAFSMTSFRSEPSVRGW